jgi:hypothetical protein
MIAGSISTAEARFVQGPRIATINFSPSGARSELTVELVEPSARIGGLVTSGLSHSDFRTFEALTGAFLGFAQRVETHYSQTYGPDSPQVRDSFRGTFGEPKVNLLVLEEMLAAHWPMRCHARPAVGATSNETSGFHGGDAPVA